MWFWPVNEMTEPVSGMPAPQFGDESSLSARIRAGPRFKQFLRCVLINVRCFRVPPGVRIPQVEYHFHSGILLEGNHKFHKEIDR
jgi:hypothetical protein